MTGFALRPATLADLDRLEALEQQIFRLDAWSREAIAAEVGSSFNHYVVVEQGDPPVVQGYAGLRVVPGSTQGDVQTIGVVAALRGHGAGRALLAELHREAVARGATELFLDVRVDNHVAQSLYRSFGYREIGVRKGYYQAENVDALVMQAHLDPAAAAAVRPDAEGGDGR